MKFKSIITILFLLMISGAYATEITSIKIDPSVINLKDKFYATAALEGETCGMGINFILDNKSFSSKLLGCDREEISSSVWDLKDDPLDCGTYTLTAELKKNNEILNQFSREIQIGNIPYLTVNPEKPVAGDYVTLKLIDNKTNESLSYTGIKVYNTRDPAGIKEEYKTDSSGEVKLRPKETGEYKIIIDDPIYCGSLSFHAKKTMTITGPIPPNPMEGETITMIVPSGVGVKVLDSSGNVYLKGSTNFGGGLNLTIDKSGSYTLSVGDLSSEYWGKNIPLYVSGKPKLDIDVTPSIVIINKPVTITVTSNGIPIDGATVDILPPGGVAEPQRATSSYGKIGYTPTSAGKYEITVQKKGYSTAKREFSVSRQLSIILDPEFPKEDEEFSVIVRDSDGLALNGVKVSVNGKLIPTDLEGIAGFKLPAGEYEILAEYPGYNSWTRKINVIGTIIIELSPPEIELGQNTKISVFDRKSNKISAEITAIKPDGTKEIVGDTYTPTISGDYEISALKTNYASINTTLRVKPHPLNLTINVRGGKLLINVKSRGNPINGIEISIDTPSGVKEKIRTDEKGLASLEIREEGIVTITPNPENANRDYESKVMTERITKGYDYNLLWILLVVIITGAIAVFMYGKRPGRKDKDIKKSAKSSLSGI